MRSLRILLAAFFLFQTFGLGELLHAQEHACAEAEGANTASDDNGNAVCHVHCGVCVHPNLPALNSAGLQVREDGKEFGPTLHGRIPAPPCTSIFHPPA